MEIAIWNKENNGGESSRIKKKFFLNGDNVNEGTK